MHPLRLKVNMTEAGGSGQEGGPPQSGGQMMFLLLMMVMMMMLVMNPDIRMKLMEYADPILQPIVPQNSLILMVFTLGSASMVVNTILRSFFMDPIAQAHIAHRQRQIGKMAQEARLEQNKVALDASARMREQMLPEQMSVQMGAFKPMMFTMVFIIAIFAWLASSVENFRVEYISLPWEPKWELENRVMWVFPVWIFAYIAMSAPLGRIIDRHIKLLRYKSHPIVVAGKSIKEPLLEQFRNVNQKKKPMSGNSKNRKQTNLKSSDKTNENNSHRSVKLVGMCGVCGDSDIERSNSGKLRCVTCRHEWR
jgi:uncharacterized membrane protein (DUF106 family)